MKIIQITDLHVAREGVETHGIDTRQNCLDILQKTKTLAPDYVVVSGDLCNMVGEMEVYEWVKKHLDALEIPYYLLVGNHDDGPMMERCFDLQSDFTNGELFYHQQWNGQDFIFLDTGKYILSQQQLDWLSQQLAGISNDVVIFMHHPPMNGGTPFMDNLHALKNMEAVQDVLFQHPYPITVFCGHYHVEKTMRMNNVLVQITPSTYFQIDQHEADFKVDHSKIALREIVVEGGYMSTAVHYLGM